MLECVLVEPRSDNAELACVVGCTVANVLLAGDVVEVDPFSVLGGNDSLCAEDHTEATRHHFIKTILDEFSGIFFSSLDSPACENVVCVMVTVMIVIVVVMMLVAITIGIIALVVVIVLMMLVTITIGIVALVVVIVVMVVLVAIAIGIIALVVVVMVMMRVVLLFELFKIVFNS